jgi:hypothetical protein
MRASKTVGCPEKPETLEVDLLMVIRDAKVRNLPL